jgi:murein DD-endopeptidase MepM/ murein hydrolase activator NlpD
MRTLKAIALATLLAILSSNTAAAQQPRVQSRNGAWLLPVAGNVLCSDEHAHIGRGSVRAWDLCVPFGSAVYPIADGVVEYAGCSNAGGYGCWLYINHGNGFRAIYAHMDTGSISVKYGDKVRQQQQIGRVGWTGMTSFGPHTHLEIHNHSATSGRVMIGDYFDRALLKYCKLCNTPGKPVAAAGTVSSGSYRSTRTLSVTTLAWLYGSLGVLLLGYLVFSPKRPLVQGLAHGLVIGLVILLPLYTLQLPSGNTVDHIGGAKWDLVYGFMRKWEGARCVYDPVRTFKGVTQGTYDRYRMQMGMGAANVCESLTEQQAKDIYYRYYFVASGADQLPTLIALHHFDFAVNAGTGAARAAYASCGNDFDCYTRYRVTFYRGARLCSLYCAGWLNRVNDLQAYARGIR